MTGSAARKGAPRGPEGPVRRGWRALRKHLAEARRHVDAARGGSRELDHQERRKDGAVAADAQADRAIHEARRALKRARACAQLLAPAMGMPIAEDVDRRARDVGRLLAPLRDAVAWRTALDVVRARVGYDSGLDAAAWDAVARACGADEGPAADSPAVVAALDQAAAELATLRALLGATGPPPPSVAAWARGLRSLHRAARRAARAALATPGDDERVHAARSRWKRLGLALRGYRGAAPALVGPWVAEVETVCALLGDDHDQVLLRERLAACAGGAPKEGLVGLRSASRALGDELRAEALARLSRLVAEPSKGFVARHRAYVAPARSSSG